MIYFIFILSTEIEIKLNNVMYSKIKLNNLWKKLMKDVQLHT